jgi:antimicrobial peptide system SdpA family protein
MGPPRIAENLRVLGFLSVILTLSWSIVFIYAVHAVMPPNPIKLPFEKHLRLYALMLLPQGWAFFTRDPREERFHVFSRDQNGKWIRALRGPNASPANFFGLKRASRAQGIEVGLLLSKVPGSGWQTCSEQPEVCLEQAPLVATIENITPHPTLCGEVGLALQKPVPWAWSYHRSGSQITITMPSKVARLEVRC